MAKADLPDDAPRDPLRRLGGGRWETRDGRFQIEPQSGTWVVVDSAQTNEFGLPLVRGPFGSLTAAREAVDDARAEGPVVSPLAGRIEQARTKPKTASTEAPKRSAANAQRRTTAKVEPEIEEPPPPPEPDWLPDLPAGDRRRARELIARLQTLGLDDPEGVARAEVLDDQPVLARLALQRRLDGATRGDTAARATLRLAIDAILHGTDDDLAVSWRLVDDRGRPIRTLDTDR